MAYAINADPDQSDQGLHLLSLHTKYFKKDLRKKTKFRQKRKEKSME